MAAISFIAVQCFQCSTMQVKQQKRSSNKWVCAVCNERQSVRHVYARSHLAKDVRLFVQSFNMSRLAHPTDIPNLIPPPPRLDEQGCGTGNRRKRMDWAEYLDPDREGPEKDEGGDGGSESEQKITTESPQKKRGRILTKYPRVGRAGGDKLQPISSERRSDHCQGDNLPMKCQKIGITESKWSEYLEECDEEEENNIYADGQLRPGLKFQFSDVQVEEEVHPDFSR